MKSCPRSFRFTAPRPLVVLLVVISTAFLFSAQAQTKTALVSDNYLSPFEREIFQEMNLARARPAEYAAHLEKLRPHFKGNTYQPPGHAALVTEEGLAALEEAIRFLRAAPPLPPYSVSKGMCLGALEHVKSQGPTGETGHKGRDGSLCEQRVARYGSWETAIGENLSYGKDTARERLITLLIDDGVPNRGHRERIFSREYKVAGVSCGDHSQMGTMCVLTFAGGFSEKLAGGGGPALNDKTKSQKAVRQF
ncbi:MAG TPA: CAP domain-containing protein [Pyrinomonadaceae bacterium]|jgi:uncharacterized protein YkwD|nr:CAP domain-containing protein [Pyrinomonadaceae bacterium]